jgi:hypothetical protein
MRNDVVLRLDFIVESPVPARHVDNGVDSGPRSSTPSSDGYDHIEFFVRVLGSAVS